MVSVNNPTMHWFWQQKTEEKWSGIIIEWTAGSLAETKSLMHCKDILRNWSVPQVYSNPTATPGHVDNDDDVRR